MGVTGIAISEEEKKELEHIKERAEFVTKNIMGTNVFTTYDVHCVNTLIEIIEKQQKELNNLKEIEQSHKEENGKLRVELEQEKEKNKTKIDIKDIEFSDFIKERYISKGKIKEFIKEETKEGTYNFKTISAKRLKELLEEK